MNLFHLFMRMQYDTEWYHRIYISIEKFTENIITGDQIQRIMRLTFKWYVFFLTREASKWDSKKIDRLL